jgi:hypothetical protein
MSLPNLVVNRSVDLPIKIMDNLCGFQALNVIFSRKSPIKKNILNNNRFYPVCMQKILKTSNLKIVLVTLGWR